MVQQIVKSNVQPSGLNAVNAITLVRDKLGAEYCAFIVQPNTVLTLADARGFADSVFYHPEINTLNGWQKEQKTILSLLAETKDLIYVAQVSKNPSGENYAGFEMINRTGLAYSFYTYSFLSQSDKSTLLKAPNPLKVMDELTALLRQKPMFEKYNKQQIIHIASGVHLGYPEKAILSTVDDYLIEPDEFTPQLINADIRGAAYYDCPQPVYSYPRRLTMDVDINTHEQLWSNILMDFYNSETHRKLAKDKAFQSKLRAISRY